ncbi:hypothetical protein C2G38_2034807 [Gigaspora rosea]|uniref:Uncharacterized protein n=1 Tax=Gigaspora rosea TaxID=44941 RepID=A0A397VM20_9GLOM|nr:hypothetical protein C2G38_2034807 [Gigaspora rosea]
MNDLSNINDTELPVLPSLSDIEDGRDIADTCKPKDYFNRSNIHETQWRTDTKESRHLKVEEPPYFNDTELPLLSLLFDIENDYDSIVDTYEPSDDFNQSDIRETQLITNVRESQYHNDIFIVVEEPSYVDALENNFDELESYNEKLQATDIELPCLNESPEVKESSDNENTEESGAFISSFTGNGL